MALFRPTFKDITMKDECLTAHIHLSRFGGRFEQAQVWLDGEIMNKMEPFVPKKTGKFLGKIKARNAAMKGHGIIVTSVPPQGKVLYPGVTRSGKPFNWTNPNTKPYWGSYTIQNYKPEFKNGVKDILLGRKK